MQHHSPMASVRIPPPAHDGGGLYNPFNAGPLGPPPPRDLSQQQQHQQVRAVVQFEHRSCTKVTGCSTGCATCVYASVLTDRWRAPADEARQPAAGVRLLAAAALQLQ